MSTPTVEEVERIVAVESPVVRNLEITYCYSRLAAACAERTGKGANWCTYATWASRQAGRTIRGEDLLERLELRLGESRWVLHPFRSLGRWLLRRGLFQPETRMGRLTAELHTPFDAFERASDAVARGNLRVFEEIGLQFARYLHGDRPEGDPLLRQAFAHYDRAVSEPDPRMRAELAFLANLEIGFHEQTRLQPQILEALDSAFPPQQDLGLRIWARGLQRSSSRLAREVITDCLMVLTLPGRVLALRTNLPGPYPAELTEPTDPELDAFLARFEPAPPARDDCGARDWSNLHQRMHYIVHLFRAFHLSEELSEPPFDADQVASIGRGVIPEGEL
jgi:hypothetical protein